MRGQQVDAKEPPQINAELQHHFANHPVFPDPSSVLDSLIEELRQV